VFAVLPELRPLLVQSLQERAPTTLALTLCLLALCSKCPMS
jgi:hypothetical protein